MALALRHGGRSTLKQALGSSFPCICLAPLLWGFAEATLFFVVPDVAVAWIALNRSLRSAVMAGIFATAGAALGGGLMHAWGAADPAGAARIVELVPAIPLGAVDQSRAALQREGSSAALIGAFTGMPYKVWSVAAPGAGWDRAAWMLAAFPIRMPRFVLTAAGFALARRVMRNRVSPRGQFALFAGGWTAFYLLYWSLMPW